jgi:hypothetical protein
MFEPTKENYIRLRGTKVQIRGRTVTVGYHATDSRGGSWERGFRFYRSEWAMLKSARGLVSMDHGKTWHQSSRDAMKSKGKLRLSSDNHGEFAFEGIQKINRQWDGPNYRWHR